MYISIFGVTNGVKMHQQLWPLYICWKIYDSAIFNTNMNFKYLNYVKIVPSPNLTRFGDGTILTKKAMWLLFWDITLSPEK